jgi:hypothetical protein
MKNIKVELDTLVGMREPEVLKDPKSHKHAVLL